MAFDKAKAYLTEKGFADRIIVTMQSSATVELAAKALGTEEARIAKSLTFMVDGSPIMIVCAGDAKVNNAKYKAIFGKKATMLTFDEVSEKIGHEVGGVCPFGICEGVKVYLDESLKRFDIVYPACGNSASAVRLTPDELFHISGALAWIDACIIPEQP